jgi:hypothetical protein
VWPTDSPQDPESVEIKESFENYAVAYEDAVTRIPLTSLRSAFVQVSSRLPLSVPPQSPWSSTAGLQSLCPRDGYPGGPQGRYTRPLLQEGQPHD